MDFRVCDTASGVLTIDRADYSGGTLGALDLRVAHHCEYADAALHTQLHWQAGDTSSPAGPTLPIPAGLWSADPADIPASGNYVIVKRSPSSASEVLTESGISFEFSTQGGPSLYMILRPANYTANFLPMEPLTQLQPGYYPHVKEVAGANRAYGGLSWSFDGQACSSTLGWIAVDHIEWAGSTLTALDLRFGGTCGSNTEPVTEQIHWVAP